ncbi:MAG: DUF3592 domain-containing protein [Myxococcales bacterium]|nr:DUF3592 domain-containing protein [Myxococcales bacterium]
MQSLDSIPPAPREPSPRARELIFRYQGGQKAFLLVGIIFTVVGLALAVPFNWGVPADLAIAASGRTQHARVLSAQVDPSVKINGRHPTVIRFAYSVDGHRYQAQSSTLDGALIGDARPEASIPIEISSVNPAWARVAGSTRSMFGYGALFALLFPVLGLVLAFFAVRSNRREIRAFVHGEPARAKVVFFGADRSVQINGRNRFKLAWEFRVGDRVCSGSLSSMSMLALEDLGKSEEVVVLYDPADPDVNTVWVD